MSDHTIVIILVMKLFFVQFFCVFLPPFLKSSSSIMSILFLSFIVPIFASNVPLISLIFSKRSLVFPFLLYFYFFALVTSAGFPISPRYSLELCIQMAISFIFSFAFRFSFFLSCLQVLFNHFAFLHFFFLGMVLVIASCTML